MICIQIWSNMHDHECVRIAVMCCCYCKICKFLCIYRWLSCVCHGIGDTMWHDVTRVSPSRLPACVYRCDGTCTPSLYVMYVIVMGSRANQMFVTCNWPGVFGCLILTWDPIWSHDSTSLWHLTATCKFPARMVGSWNWDVWRAETQRSTKICLGYLA